MGPLLALFETCRLTLWMSALWGIPEAISGRLNDPFDPKRKSHVLTADQKLSASSQHERRDVRGCWLDPVANDPMRTFSHTTPAAIGASVAQPQSKGNGTAALRGREAK